MKPHLKKQLEAISFYVQQMEAYCYRSMKGRFCYYYCTCVIFEQFLVKAFNRSKNCKNILHQESLHNLVKLNNSLYSYTFLRISIVLTKTNQFEGTLSSAEYSTLLEKKKSMFYFNFNNSTFNAFSGHMFFGMYTLHDIIAQFFVILHLLFKNILRSILAIGNLIHRQRLLPRLI